MPRQKYRFKTEKEFVVEYGIRWKECSGFWNPFGKMDYLFGLPVPDECFDDNGQLKVDLYNLYPEKAFNGYNWTVYSEMVTPIKEQEKTITVNLTESQVAAIIELANLAPTLVDILPQINLVCIHQV